MSQRDLIASPQITAYTGILEASQTKWREPCDYKSRRFFQNQPNEICNFI